MTLYGAGLLLIWRFPETNVRRDPLAMPPMALLGDCPRLASVMGLFAGAACLAMNCWQPV
jgi:hypothetical protein